MKCHTAEHEEDGDWQLVLSVEGATSPRWSPDKSKTVFVKETVDNSDIYVMDADGGNLTQLTDTSDESESNPAWSPDGTKIVFSSYTEKEEDSDIYVMDADGDNVTQLTDTSQLSEGRPAWSPDGTRIMFSARGDIYIMNADGSNQKRVATDAGRAAWSPDGTRIMFLKDSDIYVMDVDGGNLRQLTSTAGYNVEHADPAWSPDGSKIVFVSIQYTLKMTGSLEKWMTMVTVKVHKQDKLWVMDADGSHKTCLTDDSNRVIMYPHWVPRKRGVEVTEDSVIIPGT